MSARRIRAIAEQILCEKLEIGEGCDAICRERLNLPEDLRDHEVLHPFIALSSDLDSFPTGSARAHWNSKALAEQDLKREAMLTAAKPEIMEACRDLLKKWPQTM